MLRISTIVRFLLFNKEAIRQIASTHGAIWPGLLFVISAGFAREYDGEYLIAEPWHLLIPVAASLIGCFCMSALVSLMARCRGAGDVGFREVFRSFLNLYWMTAPLAWLYAIPFERFLSPADATVANLSLLGVVAVWRVALMIRAVQVLYDARWFSALVPVVLFSDLLAMLGLWLVPGPIFMIMGGVRLTESEDVILGFRLMLGLVVYGSCLFWLISFAALCQGKDDWEWYQTESDEPRSGESGRVARGVWLTTAVSVCIWAPLMLLTQSEQALRYRAESMIDNGDFESLADLTSEYSESRFPPHWDPPPRPAYRENRTACG